MARFYDYRFQERKEDDKGAYWNHTDLADKSALVEQSFDNKDTLHVPGDWNSQDRQFLHYEGTVWYQRYFDKPQVKDGETVYLYFGAANYEAHVYLNGKKLGMHKGGFTAFDFKVPQGLLKDKDNFLV
ncbi:hypothetical protein MMC31_008044, partial [Peltigera leucophlebia]|nr:hypothetical protein [Peltigera leucophlebia]